jgi:hypothetical protein
MSLNSGNDLPQKEGIRRQQKCDVARGMVLLSGKTILSAKPVFVVYETILLPKKRTCVAAKRLPAGKRLALGNETLS